MLLPLTNAQRCERFGRFDFVPAGTPSNPEAIRIRGGWAEANIVEVTCPQLKRFDRERVNVHAKAAQSFLRLWAEWERLALLDAVVSWNGSFVPRYKRGRAGGGVAALSNHSWGTAFDVCARLYPLGRPVAPDAPIRALVPSAEALGWFWGGSFRSRPDGMHFEFCGAPPAPRELASAGPR